MLRSATVTLTMSTITVDCSDAGALARFWAGALGWDVAPGASAEFAAVVRHVCEDGARWVVLADPEANEFCVALPHSLPA